MLGVYPNWGGYSLHARHLRVEAQGQVSLSSAEVGAFPTSITTVLTRFPCLDFLCHVSLLFHVLRRKDSHKSSRVKGEMGIFQKFNLSRVCTRPRIYAFTFHPEKDGKLGVGGLGHSLRETRSQYSAVRRAISWSSSPVRWAKRV